MITNTGLSPIELASAPEGTDATHSSAHRELRHALAAERVRIRHMCKALACTEDSGLRQRWQADMADSLAHVREIEKALRAGESPADQHAADMMDECLLEAMELARANGDSRAAEIVAMECMALVELRCRHIRQGHAGVNAAWPSPQGAGT
ncbi:MAG TPA: hypothetical protein VIM92_06610 [Rhodanobacteraceae bacterium]